MNYLDIAAYFGTKLSDPDFQVFLKEISCDAKKYNVAKSEYISSKKMGLDIGFKNDDAVYDDDEEKVFKKGTPVFALFNLHPSSEKIIESMPFGITFSDTKSIVRKKAGNPIKVVDFEDDLLEKHFMIDHFKSGNLAISVDYDSKDETVECIQIRDNEQSEDHKKL